MPGLELDGEPELGTINGIYGLDSLPDPRWTYGIALFLDGVRDRHRRRSAAWSRSAGSTSLFFPEHTHIPVSRETPYPSGGELPPEYSHTLDPFVALACGGGRDRADQARHRRRAA